jgi:hypothetical protein
MDCAFLFSRKQFFFVRTLEQFPTIASNSGALLGNIIWASELAQASIIVQYCPNGTAQRRRRALRTAAGFAGSSGEPVRGSLGGTRTVSMP